MISAEADGPLRTLTVDVTVTNSFLGAAGDGACTRDGTSTASAVAGLSVLVEGEASAAGGSASGAIA
jgi:hypothetical protein